ncbi:MAG TPA: GNAT family N-acetyltransferase [Burkholderiales bacterium]|nr:GNAT family N-acetyltransferase [Burkholderiales bacterium]
MGTCCWPAARAAHAPAGTAGVTVRGLAAGDSLEDLTALLHRAFSRLGRLGLNCTCVDQPVEVTRRRIERGTCYVATSGERLAGTITLYAPDPSSDSVWYRRPDVASIHQFAVDPDFHGLGVGGALLQFAEDWAALRGYREIALDMAQPARHLLAYYMRNGYRYVESLRLEGKTYYSVVLSKALPAKAQAAGVVPLARRQAFRGRIPDASAGRTAS